MCLRRRFSREVSSSDALLDTLHFSTVWALHCTKNLDYSQNFAFSDATCPMFLTHFWPYCTKTCWVFTGCSLLFLALLNQKCPWVVHSISVFWCKFPTFGWFHIFGPTVPKIVGFSQDFPLLMQILAFFHIFGPTAPRIFQLSQDFPLLMQHLPHAHTNAHTHTHTMVPAESVKFYRNSDRKQFLSVKLFFTYSKLSPREFIYVRLFFTYSEITAQNKKLCM